MTALFEHEKQRKAYIEALRFLADGCEKHPSYRAKVEPSKKCADCRRLRDIRLMLEEVDASQRFWWDTYLKANSKRQRQESEAREAWLNSPG